jgi:antitoxin ParD1/3/4
MPRPFNARQSAASTRRVAAQGARRVEKCQTTHFGRDLLAKIANNAKVGLVITWGAMPTRNVNLTEELDRFVLSKIESGRYENASEVVRAALRTLEREEQEHEAKLAALRAAIDEGDTSGVAGSGVFSRVRKTLKLPAARR